MRMYMCMYMTHTHVWHKFLSFVKTFSMIMPIWGTYEIKLFCRFIYYNVSVLVLDLFKCVEVAVKPLLMGFK